MKTTELEKRIEQLESQLTFQDDTISQLNEALSIQQIQISKLTRQLQLLSDKLKEIQPTQLASAAEETPPPHY
ncbi:MAG: Protein SlyX [Candidatus Celerinatantimonas neptuna]|nr:MAG: Protein SlyX [Candidatus Celerinatantimonas neptuna]